MTAHAMREKRAIAEIGELGRAVDVVALAASCTRGLSCYGLIREGRLRSEVFEPLRIIVDHLTEPGEDPVGARF